MRTPHILLSNQTHLVVEIQMQSAQIKSIKYLWKMSSFENEEEFLHIFLLQIKSKT